MSEVRVVDLTELGVNKEIFDKIYSMGEQDGKSDALNDFADALCCQACFTNAQKDAIRKFAEEIKG